MDGIIVPCSNVMASKEKRLILKNLVKAHKKICETSKIENFAEVIEITERVLEMCQNCSNPNVKFIPANDGGWCSDPPQ